MIYILHNMLFKEIYTNIFYGNKTLFLVIIYYSVIVLFFKKIKHT